MINTNSVQDSAFIATKWSLITQIIGKIASPITNMVLARILAPDAFGAIAIVSLVVSFTNMFTDAGFQKYLIQHEFKSDKEKYEYTNVAFFTNFLLSMLLWVLICLFSKQIAFFVGNPELYFAIMIASIQLPITSFSSIQLAVYYRDLDFKTIFFAQFIGSLIPFVITIPLAFLGLNYWAIIIGAICAQISLAIFLTSKSKWKPVIFFNYKYLQAMFSFSVWSLLETITIWFSSWIDVLILGKTLSSYYLGLYKTSITMVDFIMVGFISSILPILFSTLSRFQSDVTLLKKAFLRVQRIFAYFILPLGLGIFLFKDFILNILMGSQWKQAGFIIGIWALTSAIKMVFSDFNSEYFRATGMPKLSVFVQTLFLIILIPTCIFSLIFGFVPFVYSRSIVRFVLMLLSMIALIKISNISLMDIIKNVSLPAIFTLIVSLVALLLNIIANNQIWTIFSILLCTILYLLLLKFFAFDDFEWIKGKLAVFVFNKLI